MSYTHALGSRADGHSRSRGRAANVALWIVQVIATALFLMAGASKLGGAQDAIVLFDRIGVGQWFRYVTGVIEVAGAILLITPRFAGVAALVLVGVMIGAIVTEVFLIAGNPAPAATFLVLAAIIAFGRRDRTRALLRP